MNDFAKALKKGFESAKRAADARKEILEVFKELHEQVMNATGGKVSIERELREVKPDPSETAAEKFIKSFKFPSAAPEKYWAIVAFNPTLPEDVHRPIASWSQESAGYPCSVTWGGQRHICEDKVALSNCLAELLEDPDVAGTLFSLMQRQPAVMQKAPKPK